MSTYIRYVHSTGLLSYDITVSIGKFMSQTVDKRHGAHKRSSSSISIRPYQLIQVLPVVLRHEAKRAQQRPGEVIEVGESVVGIRTGNDTFVTGRTWAKQTQYY